MINAAVMGVMILSKTTPCVYSSISSSSWISLCLLKYFFIFLDLKDAVKEGNGARLVTLHKELLPHFKSLGGFNSYAIEMLISIVQNEVFVLEAEAYQCIWASTANWRGGPGKNVEIDILQENRNRDIKKEIKLMGANKTNKAI